MPSLRNDTRPEKGVSRLSTLPKVQSGNRTLAEDKVLEWPIKFRSAEMAVRFGDGLANAPQIRSQIGHFITRERSRHKVASKWTQEDLINEAHRISVELAAIGGTPSQIYRHVYGYRKKVVGVSDEVAHRVWNGPGDGYVSKRKTIAQCRQLAALVLLAIREKRRFGTRLPVTAIAKTMKMERQHFYEQWGDQRKAMLSIYHGWLDQADKDLTTRLREIGIL